MTSKIPANYLVTIYQQDDTNATNPARVITGWLSEDFEYTAGSNYDAPFANAYTGKGGMVLRTMGFNLMFPVMTAQIWGGSEIPEFSLKLEFHAESDPILEIKRPIVDLLKLVTPKIGNGGLLASPGPNLEPADVVLDLMGTIDSDALGGIANIPGNMGKDLINWASDRAQKTAQNVGVKIGKTNDSSQLVPGNTLTDGKSLMFNSGKDGKTLLNSQVAISIGRYLYFPSVVITEVSCNITNILHRTTGIPMHAECIVSFKPMFVPLQEDLDKMFMLDTKGFSQGTWNG